MLPPIPSTDSPGSQRIEATTFFRKMSVRVRRSLRRRQDPIPSDSGMASTERVGQKLKKKKPIDITSNVCPSDDALGIDDSCVLSGVNVNPVIQHAMKQDRIPNLTENLAANREGVVVPSSSNTAFDTRYFGHTPSSNSIEKQAQSSSPADASVGVKESKRRWKTLKTYGRRFTSVRRDQSSQPRSQPSSYESKKTEEVGDTTPNPDSRINERHASPEVQVVGQTALEKDKITTPIVNDDVLFPVASTSRDNTAIQQHCDADVVVQMAADVSDTSKNATLQPRVIPKRATTLATPFHTHRSQTPKYSKILQQFARRVVPASPSPLDRSVLNGPRSLENIPSEDKGFHHVPEKSLPPVPDQGNQRKSDVRSVSAIHSQTARESEEIKELRCELREMQKRCEAQSRDLESSNSFLNTADKSSDFDVIRALQRLNAELQQNTTYMADCLVDDFKFQNVTANELASTAQRFSKRIGHVLVDALGAGMSEEIPMLLQIAFQAYLASELCQTISSWTLRSQSNTFIAGIYERVCKSGEGLKNEVFAFISREETCLIEPQAVSGRWRVLTRGHIDQNYITHPESLIKRIIKDLSDILLVTGCTAPRSDIISKITSSFREKIVSLVELAGRLNKIFDDVISSDYEIFIVQPGEKFVDNIMEDTDGGQVVVEGKVLCATHLGLSKQVPVGTLWDQGEKQWMTVLKTKVLLESFLIVEEESGHCLP
ncbi:hypothetical protein JVU11DRAFT_6023 [Chiua virens]|nr:hypothetical protein JVU11DRAFT_6023 [Chiua virens]